MDAATWNIAVGALALGISLIAWGRLRARASVRLDEAVPECTIGELEPGRFRVLGRIVAREATPSFVDGVDCVYIECAEYRPLGSGLVPLLREVEHGAVCHPFFLEDHTGRILVDPGRTLIDCASATADGGLTAERRLRVGEQVSLTASFRPVSFDAAEHDGPYRSPGRAFGPVADDAGPPRLSHRTEVGMIGAPLDDVSAFLSGAGAIMVTVGGLLALVTAFLL